jgi:hypothetical protein
VTILGAIRINSGGRTKMKLSPSRNNRAEFSS